MGDEIAQRHFEAADFERFEERLRAETGAIGALFDHDGFSPRGEVAGFELEAWLVDGQGRPAAINDHYLAELDNPLVVPELAAFNVELNGSPTTLSGRVFTRLHDELTATWKACSECAAAMGVKLVTIGILPTVPVEQLDSRHMSNMNRYQAINDQVMALRGGRPLEVQIDGALPLDMTHRDVMLEAATTSFQVHLQCRPAIAVRAFNAAVAASAPMVAVACNSPYLFGHELWNETRIPLFEQAVHLGERYPQRVGFGSGYIRRTIQECFVENLEQHPVLLPVTFDAPPQRFTHLRFHNGTIWRWNRPLVGFDFDGQPHLRIEHRVIPSGPTISDCIANAAFYYGMVRSFVDRAVPIDRDLTFADARANFYRAARDGIDAQVVWTGGRRGPIRSLILDHLLPDARSALKRWNIPNSEVESYLGVIEGRARTGRTGAAWQRRWVADHGPDMPGLILAYEARQQTDQPVHTWPVE